MRKRSVFLLSAFLFLAGTLWAQSPVPPQKSCPPYPETPTTITCLRQRIEALKAARWATLQQEMHGLSPRQRQEVAQHFTEQLRRMETALQHFLEQYCPNDKEGICD